MREILFIELENEIGERTVQEIENPCYHCYMGAIGECIRCKYSEKEWHGDLDAIKIEISDNDDNTNRENTYPWEDRRNENRTPPPIL